MIFKKGFTIVELMVVVAVSLILTAGIAMFMIQIFSIKNSVLQEQKYLNEARTAIFIFGREIRNMDKNAYAWDNENSGQILFWGEQDQITFYSNDLSFKRFSFSLYDSDERVFKMEEFVTLNNENQGNETGESEIVVQLLARQAYDLKFAYYDGDNWFDEWNINEFPERVKLQLIYQVEDKTMTLETREWLP